MDMNRKKKLKRKLTARQRDLAKMYGDPKKVTYGDVIAARIKGRV
tara:strand:+ start:274 stop:408 length:135 start_codon:yes stop_codon:yes gene_type:complete